MNLSGRHSDGHMFHSKPLLIAYLSLMLVHFPPNRDGSQTHYPSVH